MHRQRKLNDSDALYNPASARHLVFEYGIVRVQEPNPIEFLLNKANKKFVFSDHKSDRERTWVFVTTVANDEDIAKLVGKIAEEEKFGKLLGSYIIHSNQSEPEFYPADGLLPSQAIGLLRQGVEDVLSGRWTGPV